jgi:3-hydroxyacyl-[acyl-carrier-protein] dehydratase
LLVFHSVPEEDRKKPVFFLAIDNVRFRKPVIPGDQLRLELEITKHRQSIWGFTGKAFVDEKLVAEGDLLAMLGEEK